MRNASQAPVRTDSASSPAIDPLLLPKRGSPLRTAALVQTHLDISRADLRAATIAPAELRGAHEIISAKKSEFRQLLWDWSSPPAHCPSRIFLHSEVLVPGDASSRRYVNFLAEVRNPRGDFLVLSEHGWSTHAAGPAFSHVHASLSGPTSFYCCKLYSLDAFREEVFFIEHHGVRSLLGLKPRSHILEESCGAIARLCGVQSCEASAARSISVLERSPVAATLMISLSGLGNFRVCAQLVPNRWFVSCAAVAV